ncbi:MAG TPA: hypothetical protein P5160_09770, partial [Candidatus Omnitrophota bacterium]|nr:hypothetical protein [Candidatus Omnitrophota bacterium]
LDGSSLQQITRETTMDYHPRFSPDGTKIVFTSKRAGNPDVWQYDCQSGSLEQLTSFQGRDCTPVYSPDGKKIVFVSGLMGQDGHENFELYLLTLGEAEPQRLTTSLGQDRFAAWSPDGKYLLFSSSYGPQRAERLTVMDVQSRKKEKLKFDRTKLELEIDAEVKGAMFFKYLPVNIARLFYPHQFFGAERYPDWKN